MAPPNTVWLFGIHAAAAAMGNPRRRIHKIICTKQSEQRMREHWRKDRHPGLQIVEGKALDALLPKNAVHQGVALAVDPLAPVDLSEVLKDNKAPLVVLDQVTDPHNIGAILRSAAAFNAKAVILTERHAPDATATLAKAASGAVDIIPLVYVTNLAHSLKAIKQAGYWVAGLSGEAKQNIENAKLGADTALVLGAEGKGLRRLTAETCDMLVKLPISEKMESLNVSNAAAVALYALSVKSGA